MTRVWDNQDSEEIALAIPNILDKNAILLRNKDVESMNNSVRHPWYRIVKKHIWREWFTDNAPTYTRSSIAQIRLNEDKILINAKIYTLTDFCKYCGGKESIEHLFCECPG